MSEMNILAFVPNFVVLSGKSPIDIFGTLLSAQKPSYYHSYCVDMILIVAWFVFPAI